MPIEIPFMSVIFGMYTQFIYAHMTNYWFLIPNITKGQKRVKKEKKENSPSSHFLIYWPILANDSLKFLSWQDLKKEYSWVKATKANIASNFVPYMKQVPQMGQFCIKMYFGDIDM